MMLTGKIGSLDVAPVALGCNNFGSRCDASTSASIVQAALEEGVTLFDTADVYGGGTSEQHLGRALSGHREQVIIASKFGMRVNGRGGGGRPSWVREAIEGSLRRLRTDYIDLYQMHFPDPHTPLEETLSALGELVHEGKVREIGLCNVGGESIDVAVRLAASRSDPRPATVQDHYNLLHRDPESEVLPACRRHDIGFLPYFPLESGLLTGKYARGTPAPAGTRFAEGAPITRERIDGLLTERNFDVVEKCARFASERGHRLLELAISWLIAQQGVACVPIGATAPAQVRQNVHAASWDLSPDELREIDRLTSGPEGTE